MRKLRSDALWHKLTPEQQKKIEHWFFVEQLSYSAVHERMRSEFGVTCALSVIGPMYHHCRERRSQEREEVAERLTQFVVEPGSRFEHVRPDALALITGQLTQRALQRDDMKTVTSLGRLIVNNEGNAIAKERMDLNQRKLDFERLALAFQSGAITREEFLAEFSKTDPRSDAK